MQKFILMILISCTLTSCLTGGFDENPQLEELEEGLKMAPKVESFKVNGSEVQRNTISRRVVDAKIGDVLSIDAMLSTASGELDELEFSRVYHYGEDGQEDPKPVDPATTGLYDISGTSYNFTYSYTVPAEDDAGEHFSPGSTIQVFLRAKNTLGNYGYRAVEVHIVE